MAPSLTLRTSLVKPYLNLPDEPPKLSIPSPDTLVYPMMFGIMSGIIIIIIITLFISRSLPMADLFLLETWFPFSAIYPQNHLPKADLPKADLPKAEFPNADLFLLETWFPFSAIYPQNHLHWLILFFSVIVSIIISQYRFVAHCVLHHSWSSPLQIWPSMKDFWNIHGKGTDKKKGKYMAFHRHLDTFAQHVAARLAFVLSTTKSMVEMFAQVVSKPIKWNQNRWIKAIERLCNLATWWAFVHLPTRVAAYEHKSEDVTGYGPAPAGLALFMFMLLGLEVHDSVRGYMESLVHSRQRPLKKLSYVVYITGILAAILMILAPTSEEVYYFQGGASIPELSYLGLALISVALISRMHGKCHTCKKSPCICSTGPGTGTGTESFAALDAAGSDRVGVAF